MKNFLFYLIFSFTAISCITTNNYNSSNKKANIFNQKLADSLKADQYGMRTYYVVLLKTGKYEIKDPLNRAKLMRRHLANIQKMGEEGKIAVVGPFTEENPENYQGLFIFNTTSKEEAESWVKTDPGVKVGFFDYEIFKWYGSAAIPLYLERHKSIAKENP